MNAYFPSLIILILLLSAAPTQALEQASNIELNNTVADICDKQVVLLGEDANHGSGKTIEVKVALIKRLIDECGFSAVFFESPVYEFLSLKDSLLAKTATQTQVAQSIGGMWATAKPMKPLISYLHDKAIAGKVTLAGIDAQFGANQPYSQKKLPKRLSQYLPEVRAKECEAELYQYLNWQYDDTNPYNEKTKQRINSCTADIKHHIEQKNTKTGTSKTDSFIINNFIKYQEFPLGNYFNLRDKAMADNILWHHARLPSDTKIIVWCASIHAAKTLSPFSDTSIPMGFYLHSSFENIASIGFSALSGTYGRSKPKAKTIEQGDLEKAALSNKDKQLSYLNSSALKTFGNISAHPIQYNSIKSTQWDEIFDSIIVLQQEQHLELN